MRVIGFCIAALVASSTWAQATFQELYRLGTPLSADRFAADPIVGFSPGVDGDAVYDYLFASDAVGQAIVASTLVRFDANGSATVLEDDSLTDPEIDAGYLPVAASDGEQVFSHLGGPSSAPVLDGVSHRDAAGVVTRIASTGDSRPGDVGVWDSPLVQQFRNRNVLVMDRERVGLSFVNDAVVLLDTNNPANNRTVLARGQVVDGAVVNAIVSASLGEDGSVAVSFADPANTVSIVVDRDGVIERVAVSDTPGPAGGTWTSLIGGFAWRPDGWIFSGRLDGGTIEDGVFLYDGTDIQTLLDDGIALRACSDERGNAFLQFFGDSGRALAVLSASDQYIEVLGPGDQIDGQDVGLTSFDFDAIDGSTVAFTAFVTAPGDQLSTGVAYRTTVSGLQPCVADTNGDGMLSPADYNAWILAYNTRSDACDQNGDGLCTPADYNGWILNFNLGCD